MFLMDVSVHYEERLKMNIKSRIENRLTAHNFITSPYVSTIHYSDLLLDILSTIILEFDRLKNIKSGGYGMVFAVRDLYETTLNAVCLSVCYLMEIDGDDSFCEVLFSDKRTDRFSEKLDDAVGNTEH